MKHKDETDQELKRLMDEQIQHEASCPFQCGQQEYHMHYMECTHDTTKRIRSELVRKLQKSLEKSNVHDAIIRLLIWGVTWNEQKSTPTCALIEGELNNELQQAIIEQTEIGWQNIRRGFISRRWSRVQTIYTKNGQQKGHLPRNWSKTLVSKILEVSWAMWTERNKALHVTNSKERKEKLRDKLIGRMEYLYKQSKILLSYNKEEIEYVFRVPLKKRKKHGIVAMEAWLKMATSVLEKAEIRANSKLIKWLNREATYQEPQISEEIQTTIL